MAREDRKSSSFQLTHATCMMTVLFMIYSRVEVSMQWQLEGRQKKEISCFTTFLI